MLNKVFPTYQHRFFSFFQMKMIKDVVFEKLKSIRDQLNLCFKAFMALRAHLLFKLIIFALS